MNYIHIIDLKVIKERIRLTMMYVYLCLTYCHKYYIIDLFKQCKQLCTYYYFYLKVHYYNYITIIIH